MQKASLIETYAPFLGRAAVEEILRCRRHPPIRVIADGAGFGQEVGQLSGGDPFLPLRSRGEELQPSWAELALQVGDERECLRSENPSAGLARVAQHLDGSHRAFGHGIAFVS